MKYEDLKKLAETNDSPHAREYKKLFTYSCVAGDVWPQFREHLKSAGTLEEFFESIYNDDSLRFENVWAYWAKLKHKPWADRFEADEVRRDLLLDNRGVFLKAPDSELLIPMVGRGRSLNVYVFRDNGFNERAAEFYGSIYGHHTCCGVELDGAFDIYRTDHAVIFERWDIDKLMRRRNGKGQPGSVCACNQMW